MSKGTGYMNTIQKLFSCLYINNKQLEIEINKNIIYNNIKIYEILKYKFDKNHARPVYWKLQNVAERHLKELNGASLVVQWLRICLPMQGTRVQTLVWEDPTCCRATRPVSHNYWACMSGACAPQQERPRQWEAHAPQWRVAPARRN